MTEAVLKFKPTFAFPSIRFFTARCTLVQSEVLLSYVVRLSVRLSVCP